ncbi:bifunctional adenosylcobinamide kinase/adenosylcobinamide-phosphate guanylyltransferase [Dermacoccus nishinomiyaensis]|uniref:bifunctional adenosylcobinamide kinase/adenosylcobinamide-phosphate guanylyltransferase n=1 Tax=Dermacoccus nishinomiyaensis TaxID=1274 RepID=UPI0013F3FF3E|nr:bifunctional adenosylcobinamide kinase/adenosylcobinamide-phosphate guanylyltransferase [Dermacoccus nishinomiyaensis]NHC30529.1 bifunctional adenosylcobinamide kinase/adenosylcobinamide-phosphate guanylyltransferase [Dermacoccus nishinomiyaensis]
MSAPRRVLITGGVRSGKSTYAERLLWEAPTTYLATGPTRPDDDEWRARVAAHQQRRPSHWTSLESVDVPRALTEIHGPCLLDDVGSWLTSALEESGAWVSDTGEGPRRGDDEPSTPPPPSMPTWHQRYAARADAFVAAIAAFEHDLVIVTNEVGFGLVSPYQSGRLFTDELGRLNQRLARACDDVVLVVAGCSLVIKGEPKNPSGAS